MPPRPKPIWNEPRAGTEPFLQNVAQSVSAIAQLTEEHDSYTLPLSDEPVSTGMSMDGAMLNMGNEGWRWWGIFPENQGDRLHTIYFGASRNGKFTLNAA